MRTRPFGALVVLALCTSMVGARTSQAQWTLGGYLGKTFETKDWFLVGTEARVLLPNSPWMLNPRVTYHPYDGGWDLQVDANLLFHFEPSYSGYVSPYVGIGGALILVSPDQGESDTKVAMNIVSAVRFRAPGSWPMEPYVSMQYTFAPSISNIYQLVFGLAWTLGGP